jgi:hypothetical protein
VAKTKDLTVEVDEDLITRVKVHAALTGQTVKFWVSEWLNEKAPPLPRENSAERSPEAVA